VLGGEVQRFEVRRETGIYDPAQGGGDGFGYQSLVAEAGEAVIKPTMGLAPVSVPRALVTVENDRLEVSAPEGTMTLGSGKTIKIAAVQLVSQNVYAEPPHADLSFKTQADADAIIEVMGREPVSLVNVAELPFKSMDGKVETALDLSFPMKKQLPFSQIKMAGKARLKDGRVEKLMGEYDVQGASVAFDFNNGAVEAKGEAIVRGVLARISWQRIFDAPQDRQPPLRITATLDNTDRRQLGIDLSDILTGDVPVDLQVAHGGAAGDRKIHVRADLSNSEQALSSIARRKP
jgi:hypothetical protein